MLKIHQWFEALIPIRSFSRSARLLLVAWLIDSLIYSGWALFYNLFILALGAENSAFDKHYLGLVNSMPYVAWLVFGLWAGILSDRIGRRKSMLIGLGIYFTAAMVQVLSRQPTTILIMAFLSGVGNMLYTVSTAPFMMKLVEKRHRPLLFSLNTGLVIAAGAVGNLFAGQMPTLFESLLGLPAGSASAYQVVLLISVVFGSLMMIPIFMMKEAADTKPIGQKARLELRAKFSRVLGRPIIWMLLLPYTLLGFGIGFLIPFMNVFFREKFGFSDGTLGLIFGAAAFITGICSVFAPRLAERLGGTIRFVTLSQGFSILFLLAVGFAPWGFMAAVAFLGRGALMNMAQPLYHSFSLEQIIPADQGTANSLLNIGWWSGSAIGPYVSGVIQSSYGFSPLFLITAALYGLAVIYTWIFFRRYDQFRAGKTAPLGNK